MTDVAVAAGVSAQTVSRVLSNQPNVSDVARANVLRAVEELGYQRNRAASVLSSGRSRTIGVITWSMVEASAGLLTHGMERTADRYGYALSRVATIAAGSEPLARAVTTLIEQDVEGIVVATPINVPDARVRELLRRVETVAIDAPADLPADSSSAVNIDQYEIGRLATRHLLELGHREIWHVAGDLAWHDATARKLGWETALRDAGIAPPPVLHGDWSPASGERSGQELAANPDARAVFVASDEMAFGVLRALHRAGRTVPGDVSVVGVDDIPLAAYASPGLTTVAQPLEEVGAAAIEKLLARLGVAHADPSPGVPAPRLIVRESTARL